MIEIIIGIFWMLFTGIFILIFYSGAADTISVNGELVSQAEFNAMLWPKLFFGLFFAIGLILVFVGLRKIIKNFKIEQFGEMCYGRITDIFEAGTYVDGIPELKALITIYVESTGTIEEISEEINLAAKRIYKVGDYVEGKYYNGNINITSYLPEKLTPSHIKNRFSSVNVNTNGSDSIFVDSVEYIKKDSIRSDYL